MDSREKAGRLGPVVAILLLLLGIGVGALIVKLSPTPQELDYRAKLLIQQQDAQVELERVMAQRQLLGDYLRELVRDLYYVAGLPEPDSFGFITQPAHVDTAVIVLDRLADRAGLDFPPNIRAFTDAYYKLPPSAADD